MGASAVAANNQALIYYEDYGIAKIAQYMVIAICVLSILMFFAGLYGGRLIGLEYLALVQLTFLSLLTVEDLSATLNEL